MMRNSKQGVASVDHGARYQTFSSNLSTRRCGFVKFVQHLSLHHDWVGGCSKSLVRYHANLSIAALMCMVWLLAPSFMVYEIKAELPHGYS